MEKFGIFELLDALSALYPALKEENQEEKTFDSAYLPPNYSTAQDTNHTPKSDETPNVNPPEPHKTPHPEADALSGFYARHDAVAKKAGKK